MPDLLTTDYLHAEALTIAQAAGRPELAIEAVLPTAAAPHYAFYAADPALAGDPFRPLPIFASGATAEAALRALAEKLGGLTLPIVYATATQREQLICLYNSQYTTRAEKTAMLLRLPSLTAAQAAALLTDDVGSYRQELKRRAVEQHPGLGVGVAGEAYQVKEAA